MAGQRQGQLLQSLLLALIAASGCSTAADDYTIRLRPAWNGHVKPGLPTELGIRLLARHGGSGRLTARGAQAIIHRDIIFEAGLPLEIQLPLAHDSALPFAVQLEIDGKTVHAKSQSLKVVPASAAVVAIVAPAAPDQWLAPVIPPANTIILHVNAADLPLTGQAYALLSALYLKESALQEMSHTQRQALAEYTAQCGLLYLQGNDTAAAKALRTAAGCSARNMIISWPVDNGNSLATTNTKLPGRSILSALLPADRDTVLHSLQVFLAGYIVILLLGARSARSALVLLLLPPAATTVAALAWPLASPGIQLASLAEMDSGDPMIRFAGLLQVTGTASQKAVLQLPAQLGMPLSSAGSHTPPLQMKATAQGLTLHLDAYLLSRQAFLLRGTAPGPALTVHSNTGGVRVINHGDTHSGSAILAWRGQRYTVPELAAGQHWSQPDKPENWGSTAPEQLLRYRAADGGSWLLVQYNIPALQSLAGENDTAAWLLVKGVADA